LVAAGVIAYSNSFSGVFLFDDIGAIVMPPPQQPFQSWHDVLWGPPQSTLSGRPLASLSFALNHAIGGMDVRGYHTVNLSLHIFCGLLLMGIIRRTLALAEMEDARRRLVLATTIALFWLVHPLQTEAVTYLIQRTELLVSLFYLLTLYCCIRAWTGSNRKTAWSVTAVLSCAMGMLSKEAMFSAPIVALLYDRAVVSKSFGAAFRRHWRLYLGLFATWGIVLAILLAAPRKNTVGFGLGVTSWEYLLTQSDVLIYYLRLAFWPQPLVISLSDWPVAHHLAEVWPHFAAMAILGIVSVLLLVRRPALGFVACSFFLILGPTSSIVPIVSEIAAERRMYLPLAIVIALVVLAASSGLRALLTWTGLNPQRSRLATTAIVVALAIASIGGTMRRNRDYRDALIMWRDVVAKRPGNLIGHINLGSVLLQRGDVKGAKEQFNEALRIEPDNPVAQFHIGFVAGKEGDAREAARRFELALRADPAYRPAREKLPELLFDLGNRSMQSGDLPQARRLFERLLELAPDSAAAHNSLGGVLKDMHEPVPAEQHLRRAIELSPKMAEAYWNLGALYISSGRVDEGILRIEEGLRIKPHPQWHLYVGSVLAEQGQRDRAIVHFNEALRVAPDFEPAREALQKWQ
jgi:protein O-mannosyl-transferase